MNRGPDLALAKPRLHGVRDELRSIAGAHERRPSVLGDQLVEHAKHLQPTAVVCPVGQEVVGPDVAGPLSASAETLSEVPKRFRFFLFLATCRPAARHKHSTRLWLIFQPSSRSRSAIRGLPQLSWPRARSSIAFKSRGSDSHGVAVRR